MASRSARALLLAAGACGTAAMAADPIRSAREFPSPDGAVMVRCEDPGESRRVISIVVAGATVWRTTTVPRHTGASWRGDSGACILWDAPDSANTKLWLVRRQGPRVLVAPLSYGAICDAIEASRPALRREEPHLTRSGIESIRWISADHARVHMIHNNAWLCILAEILDRRFGRLSIENRLHGGPQEDGGY